MESLSRKYLFFVMMLLIFIGLSLRLVFIDNPLWYDEAHSVLIAKMGFPFEINKYLLDTDLQHTPFYFYILHFWIKLFGENDIILKILSLIFALFSIPAIYSLARKFLDRNIALIAPLLLAFNTFHIIYSTEVRMYSLVMLLSILSVNYLYEYLETDNNKSLLKLSIVNFILPYTFTGAFVFILAQIIAVIFVFAKSRNLKNYFISNFILFIFLIPYFIIILGYSLKRREFLLSHVTEFSLANIFGIFQNFLAPFCGSVFWSTLNPFYLDFKTLIFIYIPVFVSVYLIYKAVKNADKNALLLSVLTFITFLIFVLFAVNRTIVLAPRYLIFILPLMLILVSLGLVKCKKTFVIIFLFYYCIASTYFVYSDESLSKLKYDSLISPIKYIETLNLNNKDMVIMPFASSVISHYTNENSPAIPKIEAIQELRIYNNNKIYSDETIKRFQEEKKEDVFKDLILSKNYISENFHQYILNTFLNPVEKGRYILFAVFAADSEALMSEDELHNFVKSNDMSDEIILNGILSKFFLDIHKIVQEKADLKDTKIIDNNVYFLYQKK